MAREFETPAPAEMSDDELYDHIQERFRENRNLDPDWIEVSVRDGHVTLEGRVGTDGEVQVAEKIIHDVLGIDSYTNDLIVDELHRGETSENGDDVEDEDLETHQSDTADHLSENRLREGYVTDDPQEATEEGMPYTPPDEPSPDGYRNSENH